jgi:hydroxymethylpyrimidine/phosphomethylpyrimidine kinase
VQAPGCRTPFLVLCVAGADSSGCAGIAADLRTVAALGGHGMLSITAVTAQDARGVRALAAIPPRLVRAQMEACFGPAGSPVVKIGMLANAAIVRAVCAVIRERRPPGVVLDPVLKATTGRSLLDAAGRRALLERLFPLADIVTPNLPEAEALLGRRARGVEGMVEAARALLERGARAVLLKGGHRRGGDAVDVFAHGSTTLLLRAPRVATPDTRGTGCVLSTAVACHLARGLALSDAVRRGKQFVTESIRGAYPLGPLRGPVNPVAAGVTLAGGAGR